MQYTTKEFKKLVKDGGYAGHGTLFRYLQTHSEPFTDDDLEEIWRCDDKCFNSQKRLPGRNGTRTTRLKPSSRYEGGSWS